MAYIYTTDTIYPSSKSLIVNVGESEIFTVYENSILGMADKKIFSGSSYSGNFNLTSVIDVRYGFDTIWENSVVDTSYGTLTRGYTVETSDGTKTLYRYFYSPFYVNEVTTNTTYTSNYEPVIYNGTYYWTLNLNPDGLSQLTFNTYSSGEDRCGTFWVLYFIDDRGLPSFIYLNGKTTVYETRTGELSIIKKNDNLDMQESFKKESYQKLSRKKFECNTGFLTGDKFDVMEHIIQSPDYYLVEMNGSVVENAYHVELTSSQLQTSPNARLNQNNLKLSFESIYENIIR